MSIPVLAMLVGGLVLLVFGAEIFVRGAARLAARLGISSLVIGLTVVALGTSSPEIAVSVQAAVDGQGDLALGNVIGSNIFNVLAILGVSALVLPLVVSSQLVRLDVPVMIGVSLLLFLLAADGGLGRLDGLLLLAGGIAYTGLLLRMSRKKSSSEAAESVLSEATQEIAANSGWLRNLVLILAGVGLLVVGSRWLVSSAVSIAEGLGVSQLVIGLTVVAAGTSLPELATSVIAGLRGERDIAVGNVVGSNIFNILFVLGLAALVSPGDISVAPGVLRFDLPVMTAVAIACLPIFFSGHRINRWEGALFLGYYIAYTLFLVLKAGNHEALPEFSSAMLLFVIPLTIITLLIVSVRAWREQSR